MTIRQSCQQSTGGVSRARSTPTARTASALVQLCWLALLLIWVAETRTGDTWRNLRHELDRLHLVTFATADGRVAQRSATTSDQEDHPRRARPARTQQY
jgi:hypothetical protein